MFKVLLAIIAVPLFALILQAQELPATETPLRIPAQGQDPNLKNPEHKRKIEAGLVVDPTCVECHQESGEVAAAPVKPLVLDLNNILKPNFGNQIREFGPATSESDRIKNQMKNDVDSLNSKPEKVDIPKDPREKLEQAQEKATGGFSLSGKKIKYKKKANFL